jgi:DNA mismatch repair protein MutL
VIRKLPESLIREIAAGEVITAPVDVVRELLDNALDAGATRVSVALEAGGISRITVTDNGTGMTKDQLPLAVQPHATSKLESLEAIHTLGFRGEGLFAIASAATLSITSRPVGQLGGATLEVTSLKDLDTLLLHEHPAPAGTTVTVREVFAAIPARRDALDSPASEEKRILQLVQRYLLHYPHLALSWCSESQQWSYAGGSFVEACKFVWGTLAANRLLPVLEADADDNQAQDDAITVQGMLSRPELSRPRRDRLLLAVNGRPVHWQDGVLQAVLRAYGDLLPSGHYPLGVFNVTMPQADVVVNISPDKRHVKFRDVKRVTQVLEHHLRNSLAQHPLAPALPTFTTAQQLTPVNHQFPDLHYLGRYRELYLLAEAGGDLWVIDQHAAHERIVYEELERRYQQEPPVELAQPELLPLTATETAHYLERREVLQEKGVWLEPFSRANTWRVRTVPAFLLGHEHLVSSLVKDSLTGDDVHAAWRRILARLACLPAIRAGHALSNDDAQGLLAHLTACHTPWVCPHGRPTALVLDELDLARRFGRRSARSTQRVTAAESTPESTPASTTEVAESTGETQAARATDIVPSSEPAEPNPVKKLS